MGREIRVFARAEFAYQRKVLMEKIAVASVYRN
jgi:hypothetical protein